MYILSAEKMNDVWMQRMVCLIKREPYTHSCLPVQAAFYAHLIRKRKSYRYRGSGGWKDSSW